MSIRLNSLSRLAYVPETGVGLPLSLSARTRRESSGYERMLVFYSRRLGSRQFQNGLVFTVTGLAVDVSSEYLRGLEDHDPARGDRHLNPGPGIASDAFTLIAKGERAEPVELYILAPDQCVISPSTWPTRLADSDREKPTFW